MTCGAGAAINVVLKALLDPGDEVLVLAPYFPEYLGYADNHGGVAKIVPFTEGFQPDVGALAKAVTARTKAVLVNSPNNPTGAVYSEATMQGIARVLAEAERRHGRPVYLVSDEPYAKLVYDGVALPRALRYHPASVLVTSYSKDLSLAGERIGYVAVHPSCPEAKELVDACIWANRVLGFVNAPALMQRLIRVLQDERVDVPWYQRQRDRLYSGLRQAGYAVQKPQGAFFAFPKSPLPDDVACVKALLEERVIVTPGTGFGAPGYFRVSYSVEERVLEGALKGFSKVMGSMKG
jgi:aspartate aminotransferase